MLATKLAEPSYQAFYPPSISELIRSLNSLSADHPKPLKSPTFRTLYSPTVFPRSRDLKQGMATDLNCNLQENLTLKETPALYPLHGGLRDLQPYWDEHSKFLLSNLRASFGRTHWLRRISMDTACAQKKFVVKFTAEELKGFMTWVKETLTSQITSL